MYWPIHGSTPYFWLVVTITVIGCTAILICLSYLLIKRFKRHTRNQKNQSTTEHSETLSLSEESFEPYQQQYTPLGLRKLKFDSPLFCTWVPEETHTANFHFENFSIYQEWVSAIANEIGIFHFGNRSQTLECRKIKEGNNEYQGFISFHPCGLYVSEYRPESDLLVAIDCTDILDIVFDEKECQLTLELAKYSDSYKFKERKYYLAENNVDIIHVIEMLRRYVFRPPLPMLTKAESLFRA